MVKSIKTRLESLENHNQEKPLKVIFQSWDNPALFYPDGPREGDPITWDQVLRDYSDYDLIKVQYANTSEVTNDPIT